MCIHISYIQGTWLETTTNYYYSVANDTNTDVPAHSIVKKWMIQAVKMRLRYLDL